MPVPRTGLIRVHGPLDNCCAGSRLPLVGLSNVINRGNSQPLLPFAPDIPQAVQVSSSPPQLAVRMKKRIPCAARELAAKKLAKLLRRVVESNELASWDQLLHFSTHCLHVFPRGISHYNSTKAFKKQIEDEVDPVPSKQHSRKMQKYIHPYGIIGHPCGC